MMLRFLLPALLLAACAPATVQTARTNGAGKFQFGIEPGVLAGVSSESTGVAPSFNVAGRFGVSDRVDLGARLGTGLYELQLKYMFTNPLATDRVAIAIAPSTTLFSVGARSGTNQSSTLLWDTRVPLLVGIPVGGSEFTFGPMLRPTYVAARSNDSRGSGLVLSTGGQIGFAAKVANGFRIVPQLDFTVPVLGAAVANTGEAAANAGASGAILGFQLGFLLGG